MKQTSYIGLSAIRDLQHRLQNADHRHLFLLRGKRSYTECGAEQTMLSVFDALHITVTPYFDFSVNPKMEEAQRGVNLLLQSGADGIVAVGGGSVLDMAKLIRHYAAEQGHHLPLYALPTTAGTGAETTHFAVVYIDGVKHSIEADDILPDVSCIYPPFTYNNSAYLTACTGFDALAQAIEAFWNKNATSESDEYALTAISHLHKQLPMCINNPTPVLRDELSIGAYWAGRAIDITKTTAPHAFSYAFTSKCGYPHGHAVALTFPFFAGINLKGSSKESTLFTVLNLRSNVSMQDYFIQYIHNIGLNFRGTGNYQIRKVLCEVNIQRLQNNPQMITPIMYDQIEYQLQNTKI